MAIEKSLEQIAAEQAQLAADAAAKARDAAELATLEAITHNRDFDTGRTKFQADRLRSRYISRFGLERFTALMGDSRR